MTQRAKRKLARKIQRMEELREGGKRHYEEADRLQDEIDSELPLGQVIELRNGQEAERVDPWKEKTKVWKHSACRRWEIQIRRAAQFPAAS